MDVQLPPIGKQRHEEDISSIIYSSARISNTGPDILLDRKFPKFSKNNFSLAVICNEKQNAESFIIPDSSSQLYTHSTADNVLCGLGEVGNKKITVEPPSNSSLIPSIIDYQQSPLNSTQSQFPIQSLAYQRDDASSIDYYQPFASSTLSLGGDNLNLSSVLLHGNNSTGHHLFDGQPSDKTAEVELAVTLSTVVLGITAVALFVLSLLTFVGNAMVLHAIRTEKRLQTVRTIV